VYFFVIDAFIGGAIVLVSLLVVMGSYTHTPEKEQVLTLLEDAITYMQNVQMRDFQGNYTQNLISNGSVTDTDNTLFEQLGVFYYENELQIAQDFLAEILEGLPDQMSVRFYYDDTLLFEKEDFPFQSAGLALSSKKLSIVTINDTQLFGPHIVEVIVWTS